VLWVQAELLSSTGRRELRPDEFLGVDKAKNGFFSRGFLTTYICARQLVAEKALLLRQLATTNSALKAAHTSMQQV
jgi:hypothetical protein